MHDQPTCGPAVLSPAEIEKEMQLAVLRFLLDHHPAPLTFDEVMTEFISAEGGTFGERDTIRCAIRDLASAGLLHRHDDFLLPTRAVARLGQLTQI